MKTIIIAVLAAVTMASAGDAGLAVQSAIVPGMGQIAAGRGEIRDKNTWKGLAMLGGFVVCVHNAFQFVSLQESYAEETQVRAREREAAQFFEQKQIIDGQWSRAYKNYQDAQTWSYVFMGLSAGVYAYAVADALLFTQRTKHNDENGGLTPKTELRLVQRSQRNGMEVLYRF